MRVPHFWPPLPEVGLLILRCHPERAPFLRESRDLGEPRDGLAQLFTKKTARPEIPRLARVLISTISPRRNSQPRPRPYPLPPRITPQQSPRLQKTPILSSRTKMQRHLLPQHPIRNDVPLILRNQKHRKEIYRPRTIALPSWTHHVQAVLRPSPLINRRPHLNSHNPLSRFHRHIPSPRISKRLHHPHPMPRRPRHKTQLCPLPALLASPNPSLTSAHHLFHTLLISHSCLLSFPATRDFVILRRALFARRRTRASRAMPRVFCEAINARLACILFPASIPPVFPF
jgi:hypothetical protein